MPVKIVEGNKEHLKIIQDFFERMYGADYVLRTNKVLFDWQFGETPAHICNGYHIKLAILNGKILGSLGYIPVEFSFQGRTVNGAWTANWMVDSENRRVGVGPLLMQELTRQFDITLALGLSQDAINILPRMGWTDLGELKRYVCILNPTTTRTLVDTGRFELPGESAPHKMQELPNGTTIVQVKRFSDDATTVWDSVWGNSAAGTRRSAEFLNWRFSFHPVFKYRLFEAYQNNHLVGFSVYRVEQILNKPIRVGRILELVCKEGYENCILRAIKEDAYREDVSLLDFFCTSSRFYELMTQCGFFPGWKDPIAKIPFLFQPLIHRSSGIRFMIYLDNFLENEKTQDWYVTKSDGDQDRPN